MVSDDDVRMLTLMGSIIGSVACESDRLMSNPKFRVVCFELAKLVEKKMAEHPHLFTQAKRRPTT